MILAVFSVFDKKLKAHLPPFYVRNAGEAVRSFSDACQNAEHQFCRHPEDYVLMRLCVFDDESGLFGPQPTGPEPIIEALQCVKVIDG